MASPLIPLLSAGAAVLATAGTLAYATLAAESQIFGRTLLAPPRPDQIALTFDDGPNPAATPQLLAVLARHNVRATFFLIGDYVLAEPALAREIASAGHLIGNHTMTHPFLPRRSAARIRAELAGCNEVLEQTLGSPVHFFRPPHGAVRPVVLRKARELGLTTVQFNVIAGDWKTPSAEALLGTLETKIARQQRRGRGSNIVLHDGGQGGLGQPRLKTVQAVDQLLTRIATKTTFVCPKPGGDWE